MAIEIATAAVSVLGSSLAQAAYEALKFYLKEKSTQPLPEEIKTEADIKAIETAVRDTEKNISQDEAFQITNATLAAARQNLDAHRKERMRQARVTFNAALTLAVVGVAIIFVGVALVLVKDASLAGAVTAAIGAVTEVVSALLFRFNKEANDRLDEMGKDVQLIEAAQLSMSLILKIDDLKKRDEAIREAAADLRRMDTRAA